MRPKVMILAKSLDVKQSSHEVEMLGMFMADVIHEEPVGDVTDASTFDTAQLGFMCGIEVHQQLATGKLHSRQPSMLCTM